MTKCTWSFYDYFSFSSYLNLYKIKNEKLQLDKTKVDIFLEKLKIYTSKLAK